jgi:hypothetical protein
LVAPDQGRADDVVVFVKQDGPVHLAGKANGGDGFGREAGCLERFANC